MTEGRPVPGWRDDLATWSVDEQEAWEERAAILEYEGGMPRLAAELQAYEQRKEET